VRVDEFSVVSGEKIVNSSTVAGCLPFKGLLRVRGDLGSSLPLPMEFEIEFKNKIWS
jgi:hypothetical protein